MSYALLASARRLAANATGDRIQSKALYVHHLPTFVDDYSQTLAHPLRRGVP